MNYINKIFVLAVVAYPLLSACAKIRPNKSSTSSVEIPQSKVGAPAALELGGIPTSRVSTCYRPSRRSAQIITATLKSCSAKIRCIAGRGVASLAAVQVVAV